MKNEEVQNDINDLTDKKQSLESEISRLNNPAGVEKELREKFQLKKPGEDFVVIVDENSPEASATPADSRESFLEKAWNFVKNIF